MKVYVEYATKSQADKAAAEVADFYGLPFIVLFCSDGYFYGYHYHITPIRPFSTIALRQTHGAVN